MVRAASVASCLLAIASRTDALRIENNQSPEASGPLFTKPFRQQMKNHWDLQYVAEVSVGGQTVEGILDTGSFDLVVFSSSCLKCGQAAVYNEYASKDVKKGERERVQAYGSGSCTSNDLRDKVKIGEAVVQQQDMWVAKDCDMPLLATAAFEAIVGIGPPGHLSRSARNRLAEAEKVEANYNMDGLDTPKSLLETKRLAQEDILDSYKKKDLLVNLGVKTFSACFGRAANSPGWLIWNDLTREGQPGVKQVPIEGVLTWGIKLGEVGLVDPSGAKSALSCQTGCGAIIDTGTSLIGVPSIIYNRITEILTPDGDTIDCTDTSNLPRLMFTMNGEPMYLHPSTYIGKMAGGFNSESVGFMRRTKESSVAGRNRCSLLLMDMGSRKTQFGPMFILGIPFMREYYTTFDLGSDADHKSMFLSPAGNCEKDSTGAVSSAREERTPLTVDASKIRVPGWLHSSQRNFTI